MNNLQHYLSIEPFHDYNSRLKYDRRKGFYCQMTSSGKTKCLGKGKGRQYPPMTTQSQKYLKSYYRLYNEALLKLLRRLGYSVPEWLEEELKDLAEGKKSDRD